MHVVKDKQGNVISNFYDTMKMAENLQSQLYSLPTSHTTLNEVKVKQDTEVPCATIDEVRSALQSMSRRKAAGENSLTADLNENGDLILKKPKTF